MDTLISISGLQFEYTSCWEKAHTIGALLHPCNKESEKLKKSQIILLTGHPPVAEVLEDDDGLPHPEEQLGLVFGKMGADHSNSGK